MRDREGEREEGGGEINILIFEPLPHVCDH